MTARKVHHPQAAEELLARARQAAPGARLCFELLVTSLVSLLGHEERSPEIGAILERIAERKLYRLGGYTTFDHFVRDALGISRATAHRLRAGAPADSSPPRRTKAVTRRP